jgi:hypothetical protein
LSTGGAMWSGRYRTVASRRALGKDMIADSELDRDARANDSDVRLTWTRSLSRLSRRRRGVGKGEGYEAPLSENESPSIASSTNAQFSARFKWSRATA